MKTSLKNRFAVIAALFLAMFALPSTVRAQYQLWVAGTQVSDDNHGDLSAIDGVTGQVSYNPETKVLRLQDATITSSSAIGIRSAIDGLTIEVTGTNSVNIDGPYAAIQGEQALTINGNGTLNTQSQNCAVFAFGGNLTIENCTLSAKGSYGISANNSETLVIRKANITAVGNGENGSMCDFSNITLEDCSITQPVGGHFDEDQQSIVDADGNYVTSEVKIEAAKVTNKYELYVAGTQVTDDNRGDLSSIEGVAGQISYNPETNVLTLNNVNIQSANRAIISDIENLTISLEGENQVTTEEASDGIVNKKSMTISGDGTLTINADGACALYPNNADLTIENCTVNAKGAYGIVGKGQKTENIRISNANVTAEGTTDGSITDIASLSLEGCQITQPEGAAFDMETGAVVDMEGNVVKTPVKIEAGTGPTLTINGELMTADNYSDLTSIDGVSGKVSYNPETNVLTLENATIVGKEEAAGIMSSIEGLTIELVGTNTIKQGSYGMGFVKSATIRGEGTLDITDTSMGIFLYGANLNIDTTTVNVKGMMGITGTSDAIENLFIRNATLTAEGELGSIAEINGLSLEDCNITQPTGATFNAEVGAVVDTNGAVVVTAVKIEPVVVNTYDLTIMGVNVTDANRENLSVIDGVTGGVSYDPTTNVLTLNNTTFDAAGEMLVGITSGIENLTIKLTGVNELKNGYVGLFAGAPLTINGEGSLKIEGANGISIMDGGLTIENCTLNVTGEDSGISGVEGSTLTVRNATVTAEGKTSGSIFDLKSLNLEGCHITEPQEASFSTTDGAVVGSDGQVVKSVVKIEPIPTSIVSTKSDVEAAKQGIYNLQGTRMEQNWNSLPKGVYIKDGQKVVKK